MKNSNTSNAGKYFFTLLFIVSVICSSAQSKFTVNGYISDKLSGERIIAASITFKNGLGTTSNNYGFYSFTLPIQTDSIEINFNYVGYEATIIKVAGNVSVKLDIQLGRLSKLQDVTINTSRKSDIQNKTQMSSVTLTGQSIKQIPALLGEADVLKAIQMLPGIQGGNEGSSGIYVRGGGPDQNLILLDGVPVYNASHLFGFFSIFNADAVQNVEVIKGGFPSRYGGRLSSVIDIRMKEGNKNKWQGEGGIGLLSSRFTIEGPLQKGKSSIMVSGRRTYADFIFRPIIRASTNGEVTPGYFFYDLNTKANIYLSKTDQLYLSGYFGKDNFYNKEKFDGNEYENGLDWGNATGMLRWNHEFNRKLFGNLTFHYSKYQFNVGNREVDKDPISNQIETFEQKYLSSIEDVGIKADFDWLPSPDHFVKFGAGAVKHKYRPGVFQNKVQGTVGSDTASLAGTTIDGVETDTYIEDDWRISKKLKANIGLHFTSFHVDNQTFTSLQPRVSLRYLLSTEMSLKLSYAQMNQFIHLLNNSGIGLPSDLWVPATQKVPPQFSKQWALGWAMNKNGVIEYSAEAYYKTMNNIIEYSEGASFINTVDSWQDRVESGRGEAYGLEFFVQKKKGKTTGLIGYTLSWTNRQFNNLNQGRWFPYKFDRRHDFEISINQEIKRKKVNKRTELTVNWVFNTGNATTLPVAAYRDINNNIIDVYTDRNSFRLPPYHRLDVGIRFIKLKKKERERIWTINIFNAYNRLNTFFIYRDDQYNFTTGVSTTKFTQATLFPILPSISYQFKF